MTEQSPQNIQIKAYPATTLVIETISKLIKVTEVMFGLIGLFLLWHMTQQHYLREIYFGLTMLIVVISIVTKILLKFLAESLELLRDQTQAAQASVVLERERMVSDEKG